MAAPAGFITLTFAFQREGRTWVGTCEELGTSAYGRTLERANEELEDLVLLHLNTLEQEGERERFFRENSIPFYTDKPPTKVEVSPSTVTDFNGQEGGLRYLLPRTVPIPFPRLPMNQRRRSTARKALMPA